MPLACTITFDPTTLNNDRRNNLEASAEYQFLFEIMGEDSTRKGYTVTAGSQASGIASVTTPASQGVLLTIAASAWSGVSNASRAQGLQVWMKKGSGNYQLHSIVPIDTTNTFQTVIFTEPTVDALTKTIAVLQGGASDEDLGSRVALGGDMSLTGTTQGGVTIEDSTDEIQYSPDTSTDFALAVTRGMTVTFSTLNNNMYDIARARAAEYVRWTDGGVDYQQSNRVYQAAGAIATGNAPLRLIYPIDENKAVEDLWMYASLTQNQSGGSTVWGKESPPVIDWTFSTINMDSLLQNVPAVCSRTRRVL